MKKLGFGLMRLPQLSADDPSQLDQAAVNRMADAFLQQGFTYFDTAYMYHQGSSEVAARRALVERHPRESFTLTDKMPAYCITETTQYAQIFAEQCARCGVDYFDYYLLHNLGEKNYASTLALGGFPFMQQLKAAGKVRHIGFSFHDRAALLDRILTEHPEMEYVQLQINYIDWENSGIEARKCYEVATRHQKPVIVMEPVKGGALANVPAAAEQLFRAADPDASAASWAIRFAASLPNVCMVLSGMSNFDQLSDNMGFMRQFQPLSSAEQALILQVRAVIDRATAIGCTNCRYCTDVCPQGIAIPEFFSLYNNQHQFGFTPAHANYYMNLTQTRPLASACIGCQACETNCPQHLPIAQHLQTVAKIFESN